MLPTALLLFFNLFLPLLSAPPLANASSLATKPPQIYGTHANESLNSEANVHANVSTLLTHFLISSQAILSLDALANENYGPRRNLDIPDNAIEIEPGDNINATLRRHPAGTTFLLKAGVYRMQSVNLRDGDVLMGEYGAELNGSRVVSKVEHDGDYWVLPEQTQQGKPFDKCFPEFPACKYPEQVFMDDQALSQVESLKKLRSGTFYFDYRNDKIYLADDPRGKTLEVSITPQAIEGAPNATIRNLTITKYAQSGDWMTVRLFPNMVAEYNDIAYNAAIGLSLSDNVHARHNRIRHSGRLGVIDVGSENIKFEYNELAYNNTFGYDYNWEAGGSKFLENRDLVVAHNYVHRNFGPGLWTDHFNQNTLYEYNTVNHNTGSGIFHEVSGSAVIRFNELNYNGSNAIDISNSYDTEIYSNVLKGNLSSLWARNACRSAAKDYTLKNVRFYDNVVYQEANHAGNESWPSGKAAALFAERSCQHWNESFDDWFNSVGNRWYNNTYYISNLSEGARPPFLWKETELQLEDWQAFGLQ